MDGPFWNFNHSNSTTSASQRCFNERKIVGWNLLRSMYMGMISRLIVGEHCGHCVKAKARQRNMTKVIEKNQPRMGRKVADWYPQNMMNMGRGGSKYWLLAIDEATDQAWSTYHKEMSALYNQGRQVKIYFVAMQAKKFQEAIKEILDTPFFEFTARSRYNLTEFRYNLE